MIDRLAWNCGEIAYALEKDFPLRVRLLRFLGRQSWIPKGRDRLLRLIWHPDSRRPFGFDIDFHGVRYRGNLNHYVDWLVFCYGGDTSELTLIEFIAEKLKIKNENSGLTFVDIGGNAGQHTLLMSTVADNVFVFEPFSELCAVIRERLRFNNISNVRLFEIALGLEDAVLPYYYSATANSGTGTLLPDAEERRVVPVDVRIANGDQLFDRVAIPKVDLIKIDVEGFEPLVFKGLRSRILTDRPVILTEISDESRKGFQSAAEFAAHFYEGAQFFEVRGRPGDRFVLSRFNFDQAREVLIVPPELVDIFQSN